MEENLKETKPWFEIKDIVVDFSNESFNIEKAKKNNKKVDIIYLKTNYSHYDWAYVSIQSKLIFNGTLNTPRGQETVNFDYTIKTTLRDLIDEAEIKIFEQTFNGECEAVCIHFSSGSIISKIVFGDIEECYKILKEQTIKAVENYNQRAEEHNIYIENLKNEKEKENKNEN